MNKLFFSIALLFFSAQLFSQTTFTADPSDNRNQATFTSDAPLEKIVGVASGIDAKVTFNKNDITNNPSGTVRIPVENINTGIDLRNDHLKSEMWLNASEYPYIEFELTGLQEASSKNLQDGNKITAVAAGNLTIHGVTKNISVPVEITYMEETERTKARLEGNLLRVNGEFNIKLSDYDIAIPDMVVGKVEDEVELTFDFVSSDAPPKQG